MKKAPFMETRWHVPPGMKVSEMKVADRTNELHMSASNYAKITKHLTRQEDEDAETAADEAHKRMLKEYNDEMTKDWTDSVQYQHALRQRELNELLNKEDDQNLVRFLRVKKDQEAERQMYVDKMRQKLLQRKDFPKAMSSAYLFAEVLHEREQQKVFDMMMKARRLEEAHEEHVAVLADVKSYTSEEEVKKKALHEKNKAYAETLLDQVREIHVARTTEHDQRIEEELIDQERAKRERDRIEAVQRQKVIKRRQEAKKALLEFMELQEKEKQAEKMVNEDSEAMTRVVQRSKDRIKQLMKKREQEMTNARLARGAKAFDNSKQLKHEAEMQLMHDRGRAKHEADDKARAKRKEDKQKRLRQERIDMQAEFLEKRDSDIRHEGEMVKWGMVNRFKMTEDEAQKIEDAKVADADQRVVWVEHIKEVVNAKALKKKEEEAVEVAEHGADNEHYVKDDNVYMQYAEEIRDLATENGWPLLPINRVIAKYKRDFMGEKPFQRCPKAHSDTDCTKKASHFNMQPGKRTHCPASDPSFKCRHQKERIYE